MSVNIPQNNIIINYTAGKEYLVLSTYKEYIGYYYEVNNAFFAGDKFDVNAPELVKVGSDRINKLLTNPATSEYGKISKIQIPSSDNDKIPNVPFKSNEINSLNRIGSIFLCQKSSTPIKRIDEETYISLQKNPLYKTTFIGEYQNQIKSLEEADKEIPGAKLFLSSDIIPTSTLFNSNFSSLPSQFIPMVSPFNIDKVASGVVGSDENFEISDISWINSIK